MAINWPLCNTKISIIQKTQPPTSVTPRRCTFADVLTNLDQNYPKMIKKLFYIFFFLSSVSSIKYQFCFCQSRSCAQRGHCVLRLMERPEQHTKSSFNSWVVLSRTVQPENGDFRLNLRFVSPWKANSPQQIMRTNTKKPQNLPGLCWKMFWYTYPLIGQLEYFFSYFINCVIYDYFTSWLKFAWLYCQNIHF